MWGSSKCGTGLSAQLTLPDLGRDSIAHNDSKRGFDVLLSSALPAGSGHGFRRVGIENLRTFDAMILGRLESKRHYNTLLRVYAANIRELQSKCG